MIRRALLIAAAAVALSAAVAMAFTPAFTRAGRSWSRGILRTTLGLTLDPRSVGGAPTTNAALLQQDDAVQGTFCPIRPPAPDPAALIPSGAQMSTDPGADSAMNSMTPATGEPLLPPAPAICRASPATPQTQSSDRR